MTLFTALALVLGLLHGAPAQADDAPAIWLQTAKRLEALNHGEFRAAVEALKRPSHAHGDFQTVGSDTHHSWSGYAMQLDADWWIVREATEQTNTAPPPPGIPVKTRVVGLPDLRGQIDPGLYEAVRAIHQSPSATGTSGFDPVNLIRAVNVLQRLGEEKAVAAMKEYVKLCGNHPELVWHQLDDNRIILVTRLLYRARKGDPPIRSPGLGGPVTCLREATLSRQLFPLVLQNDVPFLINGGYVLGGVAEDPISYLSHCRAVGVFLAQPLAPSSDPVVAATTALDKVTDDLCPQYAAGQTGMVRRSLRLQAIAALGEGLPISVSDVDWEAAKGRRSTWDSAAQDFVVRK